MLKSRYSFFTLKDRGHYYFFVFLFLSSHRFSQKIGRLALYGTTLGLTYFECVILDVFPLSLANFLRLRDWIRCEYANIFLFFVQHAKVDEIIEIFSLI